MAIIVAFNRWRLYVTGIIVFAFLFLLPALTSGQKNRPVMKDVNVLLGILNRDYYTTDDVELRFTAIQNDRANVITILKTYATNDFKPIGLLNNQADIDQKTNQIKLYKQELIATGGLKKEDVRQTTEVYSKINSIDTSINSTLKARDELMFKRDENYLTLLAAHFATVGNVFLEKMTKSFISKFKLVQSKSPDTFAIGSGLIQTQKSLNLFSGGALTLTNAIDGLATFMAKRIKEELAAQVFDKIKEMMNESNSGSEKFGELKILLPRTTQLLKTVAPEQYQGIISSLKESINRDLDELLLNVIKLDQSPRVSVLMQQHPEVELAFLGMQLINDLNKARNPADIIFLLENSSLISRWSSQGIHKDFVNGIKLTALLTYAITEDVADRRKFIAVEEWDALYKNSNFYNLFTGLVFQQNLKYYNIQFAAQNLNSILSRDQAKINDWYELLSPKIKDMLRQASEIEAQVDALKAIATTGKKLPIDSVAQLLKSSVSFLDSAISTTSQLMSKLRFKSSLKVKSTLYFSIARSTIDLYVNLHSKQYYSAIADATGIFITLQKQTHLIQKQHYLNLLTDLNNYSKAFQRFETEAQSAQSTFVIDEMKAVLSEMNDPTVGLPSSALSLLAFPTGTSISALSPSASNVIADLKNTEVTLLINWLNFRLSAILKNEGLVIWKIPPPQTSLQTREELFQYLDSLAGAISPEIAGDPEIIKVVNFLAALAKAQNAEDFSKAIEAIVLPAGSAVIKREAAFNISLNGYAGFFGGIEQLHKTNDRAGNVAFTVPIGVAFSKSFRKPCEQPDKSCKKSGSWSIFVSAVDIGAFTSVRFRGSDQTLPEIKFKNILAPGVHLIYGIPKTSFSLAAGFQYGPFLRKISDDTNTTTITETTTTNAASNDPATTIVTTSVNTQVVNQTQEKTAFHYGISFLIDIPLMNFYTKSKGMK